MNNRMWVLLDSYTVQQDLRIRLPKCVQDNLGVQRGVTRFDILLDTKESVLVLKPHLERNEMSRERNE